VFDQPGAQRDVFGKPLEIISEPERHWYRVPASGLTEHGMKALCGHVYTGPSGLGWGGTGPECEPCAKLNASLP
jgi:hypothetical protein